MTIYEAMRSLIIEDEQIKQLLAERVYPLTAPETAQRPFAVYTLISEAASRQAGFKTSRYTIEVTPAYDAEATTKSSDTYTQAHSITAHIERVLTTFSGDVGRLCILRARSENKHDTSYNANNPDGVACDFLITYQ